jgi:DNA repair protein RadC
VSKALKPDYLGHRKRIKAKYKSSGIKGWLDYEVLEFALSFTILRKDTKPIAKQLLSEFKTLNGVLDADRKELEKVGGISEHSALFLNFLKDISVIYLEKGLYKKDLVSSSDVVYDYLKASLKGLADEEFKVMFLNSRNRLLAIETIQKGTVNKSVVYPRKIVERALYHHATGVIISHNHPGESLKPSEDDYSITKAIKAALRTVDIVLLDHIIIGGNGYFSFKENGVCNDFEEV